MTIAQGILVVVGLLSGLVLISALLWSIVRPSKRIWPPNRENSAIPNIAWGLTLAVFGAVIGLGIVDLKSASMPNALRWAVGPFLIATGNLIVWWGAFSIGLKATSGARDELITSGLYRFSRNPQYLADMAILIGLGLLFASPWVWPVVIVGVAALALAPLAEEPWLCEQYGSKYRDYCAETRRYL